MKIHKKLFTIGLITLITALCSFPLTVPDANARNSSISREAVDFLTKTGQAMAEVAEAVKPAVVNISTTMTEQAGEPLSPYYDDPFFRKFFGDQLKRQKPRERKSTSLGSGVIVVRRVYSYEQSCYTQC